MPTADRAQTIRTVAVGCTLLALGGGLAFVDPTGSAVDFTANVATSMATNFLTSLGVPPFREAFGGLFGATGDRSNALRAVMADAWRKAIADLTRRWSNSPEARQLSHDADRSRVAAQLLADLGNASELSPLECAGAMTALAVGSDLAAIKAALAEHVAALVDQRDRSDAAPLIQFLQAALPNAVREEVVRGLAADTERGRQAQAEIVLWIAGHLAERLGHLQHSTTAGFDAIGQKLDRLAALLGAGTDEPDALSTLATALDELLSAIRVSTSDAIAAVVEALGPGLGRIEEKTDQVLAGVERIEATLGRQRQWRRPTPPPPDEQHFQGRKRDLDEIKRLLLGGDDVAITAAVHGAAGIGKTTLAQRLAVELDGDFPGGVIFEQLGPGFRSPELADPIFNRWALFAFGGQQPGDTAQFDAPMTRALLATAPDRLLIVLDDVRDLTTARHLMSARPPNSSLLLTSRNEQFANRLAGRTWPLDVLDEDAAVALLVSRIPAATTAHEPILKDLATTLGRHALALDLAGRRLAELDPLDWSSTIERIARAVTDGTIFDSATLQDDYEPNRNVEAVLQESYNECSDVEKERFRSLGAFAPSAEFSPDIAAECWKCSSEEATASLARLARIGLVTRRRQQNGDSRWSQHGLIRAYALALSARLGEAEAARQRHAEGVRGWLAAVGPKEPRSIIADHAQLEHAFDWILARDTVAALTLADEGADLQADFSLAPVSYRWAMALWARVRESGDADLKGAALNALGTAALRLADYGGQDRDARLREALAAYDGALRYSTAERAPVAYAATRNNRGNVLKGLVSQTGAERRTFLLEALGDYREALRFRTAERFPLAYAETQNNCGIVLSDLADEGVDDPREWLLKSLQAYYEALRFHTAPRAPREYANVQTNRAATLGRLALEGGDQRRGYLLEALKGLDEALRFRPKEHAPVAYAATQHNRGNVLRNLAGEVGENRRMRLLAALDSFQEVFQVYVVERRPFDFAMCQYNRARVLVDLSTVDGEDRRARLLAARSAYAAALRVYTAQSAPGQYATTQNNRGNVLRDLAGEVGEDRRALLLEALEAYGEALRFRTAEQAPQQYAVTQNNIGNVLKDLAGEGREDGRERLEEALRAYGEALRFLTPERAPLQYAATQNNRGAVQWALAGEGGEDRRARLLEALGAYEEALRFYTAERAPLQYAGTQNNRGNVLRDLAGEGGEDRRARLAEALGAYEEALRFYTAEERPREYEIVTRNRQQALDELGAP